MAAAGDGGFSGRMRTVTVCGGGNSAHTSCGYLAATGFRVRLLTRKPETWTKRITVTTKDSSWESRGTFVGTLDRISKDPAEVIPGSDLIFLAGPAHAAAPILSKVAKHITRGTVVGTVFAQGGFDWVAQTCLKEAIADGRVSAIFGLQNIPWITIKTEHGKSSKIAGPKDALLLAASPPSAAEESARLVERLFSIPCNTAPNFLSLTLTPSNQIIHPARYYSIFKGWDGKRSYPRSFVPTYLYGSFDTEASEHLAVLDNELQQVKAGLLKRFPDLDLSYVMPIKERIIKGYGAQVTDTTSLCSVMATNKGYAACKTPVALQDDGTVKPAVASRLFWEDMPYGLCILKNLAQLMDIPTPRIDLMITWHQQFMGKRYLDPATGLLDEEEVKSTGAPAAYGLKTLEQIVAPSLPHPRSRL